MLAVPVCGDANLDVLTIDPNTILLGREGIDDET